eukprot:GHVL01043390.1.p1 GENE.GHVL01043390.1~~GHVL01043390.1.p1  ORF type:complete len:1019 (-),score=162.20 GHVL01043390.1:2362-5418(-)
MSPDVGQIGLLVRESKLLDCNACAAVLYEDELIYTDFPLFCCKWKVPNPLAVPPQLGRLGEHYIAISSEREVCIISRYSGDIVRCSNTHCIISAMEWHSKGNHLFIGGVDGSVAVISSIDYNLNVLWKGNSGHIISFEEFNQFDSSNFYNLQNDKSKQSFKGGPCIVPNILQEAKNNITDTVDFINDFYADVDDTVDFYENTSDKIHCTSVLKEHNKSEEIGSSSYESQCKEEINGVNDSDTIDGDAQLLISCEFRVWIIILRIGTRCVFVKSTPVGSKPQTSGNHVGVLIKGESTVMCTRPGGRLWIADSSGTVISTLKFTDAETGSKLNFNRLKVLNRDLTLAWSEMQDRVNTASSQVHEVFFLDVAKASVKRRIRINGAILKLVGGNKLNFYDRSIRVICYVWSIPILSNNSPPTLMWSAILLDGSVGRFEFCCYCMHQMTDSFDLDQLRPVLINNFTDEMVLRSFHLRRAVMQNGDFMIETIEPLEAIKTLESMTRLLLIFQSPLRISLEKMKEIGAEFIDNNSTKLLEYLQQIEKIVETISSPMGVLKNDRDDLNECSLAARNMLSSFITGPEQPLSKFPIVSDANQVVVLEKPLKILLRSKVLDVDIVKIANSRSIDENSRKITINIDPIGDVLNNSESNRIREDVIVPLVATLESMDEEDTFKTAPVHEETSEMLSYTPKEVRDKLQNDISFEVKIIEELFKVTKNGFSFFTSPVKKFELSQSSIGVLRIAANVFKCVSEKRFTDDFMPTYSFIDKRNDELQQSLHISSDGTLIYRRNSPVNSKPIDILLDTENQALKFTKNFWRVDETNSVKDCFGDDRIKKEFETLETLAEKWIITAQRLRYRSVVWWVVYCIGEWRRVIGVYSRVERHCCSYCSFDAAANYNPISLLEALCTDVCAKEFGQSSKESFKLRPSAYECLDCIFGGCSKMFPTITPVDVLSWLCESTHGKQINYPHSMSSIRISKTETIFSVESSWRVSSYEDSIRSFVLYLEKLTWLRPDIFGEKKKKIC